MADDLGFSDLGCDDPEVEIPNLDHLAKEGFYVWFSSEYITCSMNSL